MFHELSSKSAQREFVDREPMGMPLHVKEMQTRRDRPHAEQPALAPFLPEYPDMIT